MTPREEFLIDLSNIITNSVSLGSEISGLNDDEDANTDYLQKLTDDFTEKWAPENIEDKIQKSVQEIRDNHHKIIDDWSKAYMAELYQEGIELKPGCFSLIEQQDFVLENGKMAKKYWFEPTNPKEDLTTNNLPKSNDSLEKDNTMDYKTIETLFTYHPAPDLDVKHFEELREGAKYLGKLMLKYGKRKDDTSLAIQKLRESLHFAISSIVVPEDGE